MKHKLALRLAEEKDCRLLWKLRNEKTVREAFFDSKYIPYEKHKEWFDKKIKNKNSEILIIQNSSGGEIGEVRFDFDSKNKAEVHIIIDGTKRVKGYGTRALKLSCEYVFKNFSVKAIIAYIKKENMLSLKIFKKVGFANRGLKKIKEFVCYKMFLKNNQKKPGYTD